MRDAHCPPSPSRLAWEGGWDKILSKSFLKHDNLSSSYGDIALRVGEMFFSYTPGHENSPIETVPDLLKMCLGCTPILVL